MQHPDEGIIHAWLDGGLSDGDGASVSAHVAGCRDCAQRVAEARGLIAGASRIVSSLDGVHAHAIPAAPANAVVPLWRRLRLTPARAALAASVIMAISALLAVRHDTPNKQVLLPSPGPTNRGYVDAAPAAAQARAPAVPAPAAPLASTKGPARHVPMTVQQTPAQPSMLAAAAPPPAVAPEPALTTGSATSTPNTRDSAIINLNIATARRAVSGGMASSFAENRKAALDLAVTVRCFVAERDSLELMRPVPGRFMLTRDELTRRNVVRAIVGSKVDSIVPGSQWSVDGGSISVRFMASPADVVSVVIPLNGEPARVISGERTALAQIRPTNCLAP